MPRISRKNIKSHYIHVVIQGIEKRFIFQKNESKKYYLELLYRNLKNYPNMYILAYCIMDNHIHFDYIHKNFKEDDILKVKSENASKEELEKIESGIY